MKRFTSILLTLLFAFSILYLPMDKVQAAGDGDIVIDNYTINGKLANNASAVSKDSPFDLELQLKKIGTIADAITVEITPGNFYALNSDSIKTVDDNLKVAFKLAYDGTDTNKIPISIKYSDKLIKTFVWIKTTSSQTTTDTTPEDTSKYAPKLTVVNGTMPNVNAGEAVTIPVTIKNVSYYAANNITITPELDDNSPFTVDNLTQSQVINSLTYNQSETINFKFKVDQNAAEKIYKVKLNFTYNNYSGDNYGDSTKSVTPAYMNIKVTNQNTSPNIVINNVKYDPVNIQAGQNTKLSIDLYNTGNLLARDIRISLIGLKEDGFTILNGTNTKAISKIYGYAGLPVEFTLGSSEKMATGNYGLTLKIDYKDSSGKDYSQEQQFFIPVTNNNIKTTPKLILKQYNCDPGIVRAGENFKLSLSFYNTSKYKEVQNIKVYFTMTDASSESGNVFTPVNSSNTIFIDSIGPKETINQTLEFFTIPDAKARTYTMTANFEYEDSDKNEFKSSEIIGIPVNQQVRVDTSEISMPPEAFVGQPLPVSLDFYNMGKVMLRNFMVRVEGDFDSQNGKYFVGNFDIGASDHYEGTIIPKAVGNVNGSVVISFEDPAGKAIEIRKDFTLNVTEMPAPTEGAGMPPEGMDPNAAKGKASKKVIWIVSILAAAGVVTGVVVRRKIKKKKGGMTLDE